MSIVINAPPREGERESKEDEGTVMDVRRKEGGNFPSTTWTRRVKGGEDGQLEAYVWIAKGGEASGEKLVGDVERAFKNYGSEERVKLNTDRNFELVKNELHTAVKNVRDIACAVVACAQDARTVHITQRLRVVHEDLGWTDTPPETFVYQILAGERAMHPRMSSSRAGVGVVVYLLESEVPVTATTWSEAEEKIDAIESSYTRVTVKARTAAPPQQKKNTGLIGLAKNITDTALGFFPSWGK